MNQKLLDKKKTKELDRTTEISIGELNRNKLVDEITSKELSKPKELEYVITWVMAKANGIDDYNWGQKQFEKDLRKKLELLLTQQRTELLEEIKNMPIEVVGNSQATVNQIIRLLNKKDE